MGIKRHNGAEPDDQGAFVYYDDSISDKVEALLDQRKKFYTTLNEVANGYKGYIVINLFIEAVINKVAAFSLEES